jgi:enolase
MPVTISAVRAREILDSRGIPTVEADVALSNGRRARASVPSGRSKSRHEAVELRDSVPDRYLGMGVQRAVSNVNIIIGPALVGRRPDDQRELDALLVALDGTQNKSVLGSNATLAVSIALARAGALVADVPLWQHLDPDRRASLPLPMVNVISGGLHALGGLSFQDFLILPIGAHRYSEALEMCSRVHAKTAQVLSERGLSLLKADEGGFAPTLDSPEAALDLLVDAIARAGFEAGSQIALGIDVAASHFFDLRTGLYRLGNGRGDLDAGSLIDMFATLVETFPIVSIEDGLAEDDWENWRNLTDRLGARVQIIGDDLFATDCSRLQRGVQERSANAVLIKMNQVGTLSETFASLSTARGGGFRAVVSARSGETEDDAVADLAVGSGAGQIKIGSLAQSDRVAKYNQLLRIEEELGGGAAPFSDWRPMSATAFVRNDDL